MFADTRSVCFLDLSLDLVVDSFCVKLELLHEGACRAALTESVIDADLCNLNRILFSKNIAYCAAHTADNGVLFNCEYSVCLLGELKDSILVDGLDRVDVNDCCADAVSCELLSCA